MEEEKQSKEHRVSRRVDQSGSQDQEPCSGKKRCRSWAAAAIADCVALCCCPCAVLNLFTLAFVKVPWMIGRKCVGRGGRSKKRRKKISRDDDCFQHHRRSLETVRGGCCGGGEVDDHRFVVERDGSLTKEEEDKTASDETRISARVEAERVWLELYQIGHLGFGRVSFTGIH